MRKKILAANWKMNLTHSEAESYLETFLSEIGQVNDIEIVIIPPFTAIPALVSASGKVPAVRIGAQNMHWEKNGAFTGEVSATMLRALYVKYVIIGHSERRALFGETDEIVNRKVRAALDAGLRPILCVGESLHERDSGQVAGRSGPADPPRRRRLNRHTPLFDRIFPSFMERRLLTGFAFNTAEA
jgi:triosephosphate isomerase